jgi:hypothetical protein
MTNHGNDGLASGNQSEHFEGLLVYELSSNVASFVL